MNHRTLVMPALLLASLLAGREASAQVAKSFEQLEVLVKPNDEVSVTDFSGQVTQGRIGAVSASSLRLNIKGAAPKDFAQTDIVEIRQRRADSLANGAKIGAIVGLGIGILGSIALCHDSEFSPCFGWAAFSSGVYTAMATGVGVGIDALIVRQQTIYRAPARASASRLRLTPQFASGRAGIKLSFFLTSTSIPLWEPRSDDRYRHLFQ